LNASRGTHLLAFGGVARAPGGGDEEEEIAVVVVDAFFSLFWWLPPKAKLVVATHYKSILHDRTHIEGGRVRVLSFPPTPRRRSVTKAPPRRPPRCPQPTAAAPTAAVRRSRADLG